MIAPSCAPCLCPRDADMKLGQTLGDEQINSSPSEKDLQLLVDERLHLSWQWKLAAQKVYYALGCIKSIMASRSREVILPSTLLS
ncbi:hypothetical protein BTVI_142729 [Pitangus sulphuratus]|nr:hypothetical protein BTVI_142729 [Pitangus sulphuratus]